MIVEQYARIGQFLQWWRSELVSLVPPMKKQDFVNTPSYELMYDDRGLRDISAQNDNSTSYPVTVEGVHSLLFDLKKTGYETQKDTVHIRLQSDCVHFVEETYPLAASSKLAQFLNLKIEQDMPFNKSDVYADSIVVAQNAQQSQVLCGFVKRAVIDDILDVSEQAKMSISNIFASSNSASLSFLPAQYGAQKRKAQNIRTGGSYLMLFICAGFLLFSIHSRLDRKITLLNNDLKIERTSAKLVQDKTVHLNNMISSLNMLREQKEVTPNMSSIIEDIARILPDDTSLSSLKIEQGRVEMTGLSLAAAKLLERFDQEEVVFNVEFLAPVTLDKREGKERFSLVFSHKRTGDSSALVSISKPTQARGQ